MQKSNFFTTLIILVILVYILTSQFCLMNLGTTYTFIINPLFFISISLILKFFTIPPYSTNKFKKDIIQYVLMTTLSYSLIYLISGLLVGFGKNPYSSTVRGIIINLFATGLIILCREYIRYKLINNVYNNNRNVFFVMLVIVFTLLDFNLFNIAYKFNIYNLFKSIFYILLPSLIKNILFTYIETHTDYIPAFIYDILYYIVLWTAPILPKSPWILEAILNSIFPLFLLLQCKYLINKKNRFHLNSINETINPSGLLPFGITFVLIIWFALGIFPIKPVGVATGSMLPNLHIGDLAIIQKCTSNDLQIGDIIEYQMDGYTVIHRVIDIYQTNGEFFFTTKGDNNKDEDKLPVREEQLLGKVIFKIRYLALPTVWFHNINTKTQVEVETGT